MTKTIQTTARSLPMLDEQSADSGGCGCGGCGCGAAEATSTQPLDKAQVAAALDEAGDYQLA